MTPAAMRRLLDVISLGMFSAVRQAVRLYLSTSRTPDDLATLLSVVFPTVQAQRRRAYMLASDYLASQHRLQGGFGRPFIPNLREYRPEATEKAIRRVLTSAENADPGAEVAKSLQVHVEDAVRTTIADAAGVTLDDSDRRVQPKAWARMLTGSDNCAFCVMLASRGAVYASRDSAGGGLNRFHPNCDCVAVPVFNLRDWPGRETADQLADFYSRAQRNHNADALNSLRRELRAHPDAVTQIVPNLRLAA